MLTLVLYQRMFLNFDWIYELLTIFFSKLLQTINKRLIFFYNNTIASKPSIPKLELNKLSTNYNNNYTQAPPLGH